MGRGIDIMFENIRADIARHTDQRKGRIDFGEVIELMFTQGIWAILVYRFGRGNFLVGVPVLAFLPKALYFILNKMVEISTGISICSNAVIGPGLYLGHFGGIFIHGSSRIGARCSIGQGVTIGTLGLGKRGAPVIGDNVFIGAGAKVLGKITVGNNVKIGANAVVLKDVPDEATVVGIPARIVSIRGIRVNSVFQKADSRVFSDEIHPEERL